MNYINTSLVDLPKNQKVKIFDSENNIFIENYFYLLGARTIVIETKKPTIVEIYAEDLLMVTFDASGIMQNQATDILFQNTKLLKKNDRIYAFWRADEGQILIKPTIIGE